MSPPTIRTILQDHDLAALRQLGQNFLVNPKIAERIVDLAAIDETTTVVEIGVGFGSLTLPLAQRAARVIGIEIDRGIITWHREHDHLPANVELRHQDALTVDYAALAAELGDRLVIVANLPYSISSPLLFAFIDAHPAIDRAVLMLQKEVADRLVAPPGSRQYGILTVLLARIATTKRLLKVGPGNFYPRPKVDSAVVGIDFLPAGDPRLPAVDGRLLQKIVKLAFGQRRKTIANALVPLFAGRQELERVLAAAGIDGRKRPDQLTPPEYCNLAAAIGG